MSAAGPKKGIFGLHRAKAGQAAGGRDDSGCSAVFLSRTIRRMPAKPIDVMSLSVGIVRAIYAIIGSGHDLKAAESLDHEFVI